MHHLHSPIPSSLVALVACAVVVRRRRHRVFVDRVIMSPDVTLVVSRAKMLARHLYTINTVSIALKIVYSDLTDLFQQYYFCTRDPGPTGTGCSMRPKKATRTCTCQVPVPQPMQVTLTRALHYKQAANMRFLGLRMQQILFWVKQI